MRKKTTRMVSTVVVALLTCSTVCMALPSTSMAQDLPPDIELPEEFASFGEDSDFGAVPLSEEEEATANNIRNLAMLGGGLVLCGLAAVLFRKRTKKSDA